MITPQLIFCLSSLYLLANAFLPLLPVKFSVLPVISNPCHCNLFLPSKKSIYLLEDLLQSLNESQGPQLPYLTCELLESMQQPCLPSRGGAVYYSPATAGGEGLEQPQQVQRIHRPQATSSLADFPLSLPHNAIKGTGFILRLRW